MQPAAVMHAFKSNTWEADAGTVDLRELKTKLAPQWEFQGRQGNTVRPCLE